MILDTYGGADTVCKRIREMTNGRFTITPFAAGEIVPGLQVLDAGQAGTVECADTTYTVGTFSLLVCYNSSSGKVYAYTPKVSVRFRYVQYCLKVGSNFDKR
ncbi:hypothetical protein [Argonema antarcticum]|uniref:hypothetical protein n=1 Tax=Argonema antarcticum TaxID=2942763 RepID=UPI003B8488C0